jgi:hypothetical protein
LIPGLAQAWSVAVVTDVQGGPLNDQAVQSALWHALKSNRGHDVLVLPDDLREAEARMADEHLTTLLRFQVRWHAEAQWLDGGILADEVPIIAVTEHRVGPDGLREARRWQGTAPLAVFAAPGDHAWTVLPEVTLQAAIDHALQPVQPVTWFTGRDEPVRLAVVLCADDAWRANHGMRWKQAALARLDRAADLLRQADLSVTAVGWCEWAPDQGLDTLPELLDDLAGLPLRDGTIRVGFTGLPQRPATGSPADDVGRAHTPGRDLVVVDQGLAINPDPDWDVAAEGSALAHELLHVLGLPHQPHANSLMSAVQRGSVHTLSPATRALALSAAEARYAHWDPVTALQSLSLAAERWMDDPELQVDFIRENLALGPGVPHPGQVAPTRVSALSSVALTRHWLAQPINLQKNDALHTPLLAHGTAAMEVLPELAEPLMRELNRSAHRPPVAVALPLMPQCGSGVTAKDCPTK